MVVDTFRTQRSIFDRHRRTRVRFPSQTPWLSVCTGYRWHLTSNIVWVKSRMDSHSLRTHTYLRIHNSVAFWYIRLLVCILQSVLNTHTHINLSTFLWERVVLGVGIIFSKMTLSGYWSTHGSRYTYMWFSIICIILLNLVSMHRWSTYTLPNTLHYTVVRWTQWKSLATIRR